MFDHLTDALKPEVVGNMRVGDQQIPNRLL